MMMSSQLTARYPECIHNKTQDEGTIFGAKAKVVWTCLSSKTPALWWSGNCIYLPKKKANTICLTSERFISPAARTPRWKHRHFCWSFQVLSAIIRTLSTLPEAPGHFGETANANSRNAKAGSLKKTPLCLDKSWTKYRIFSALLNRIRGMYQTLWDLPDSYLCQFSCIKKKSMMIFVQVMYSDPGIAQSSLWCSKNLKGTQVV